MGKFGDFIDRWGLIDGPLIGANFTWSNFQYQVVLSRIDRFLFCGLWEDLFPNCSQVALTRTVSDHTPILLKWKQVWKGPSPFKFEEIWFMDPDFMEVVDHTWNNVEVSGTASRRFALKLKALRKRLHAWNKYYGDSLKSAMEACRVSIMELDKLEEVQNLSGEEKASRIDFQKENYFLALKEEFFLEATC